MDVSHSDLTRQGNSSSNYLQRTATSSTAFIDILGTQVLETSCQLRRMLLIPGYFCALMALLDLIGLYCSLLAHFNLVSGYIYDTETL